MEERKKLEKLENALRRKRDKAFAVQLWSKTGCDHQHLGLVCLVWGLCETVPTRSPTNKEIKKTTE